MKNLFSLIAIAFVMVLSVQEVTAQSLKENKERAEVVAKEQVADLSKELNLTGDQQRTLYRAFVTKEVNYRKYVNGNDLNDSKVAANKKKTDDVFMEAMKTTLTKEQFEKWQNNMKN